MCFRRIGGLRAMTNAPFIALTATAPQGIKETICGSCQFHEVRNPKFPMPNDM